MCRWIWCHIKDATLELRWTEPKTCERWNPHKIADDGNQPKCTSLRKKRTCQPKLVRARSIGPGTMRTLQQPPATGIASLSRLSDTASTAPSFVIDLFSANTDLQTFFLEQKYTVRKTRSFFLMTTQFFYENSRDFAHPGKWSDPRRNALAASIFAASCQTSSTCAKRDTTLAIASFDLFAKDNLCVAACLRGQSMHQFEDSFFSCQPSRRVFVGTQWTAKK